MLQLLDFAGIYFRAFFAVPSSITAPNGRPINAVRGSLDIMSRVLADAGPTRVVACLDLDWRPDWRVQLIPSYKTHRVATPQGALAQPAMTVGGEAAAPAANLEAIPHELSRQVPVLLDVVAAFGIATAGAYGYEADDVIGTLAARERTDPVEVVTGDRDLFQVARDEAPPVTIRYIGAGMSKTKVYSAADVAERYGISPGLYADFAALRGDPSDGLPGVPGIGEKTAATLIARFGSIDGLVAALDDPSGMTKSLRAKLSPARSYLLAAQRVVRVAPDAEVLVSGDDRLPTEPEDPAGLERLAAKHGIENAVRRLAEVLAKLKAA